MSKGNIIIIAILGFILCFCILAYHDLSKYLSRVEKRISYLEKKKPATDDVNFLALLKHTKHEEATNSYIERLLEGLVRKADLPLESARHQWEEQWKDQKAMEWSWYPPWENNEKIDNKNALSYKGKISNKSYPY